MACLDSQTNKVSWIFFSQCINPIVTLDFIGEDKLAITSELGAELVFVINKDKFLDVQFN